MTDVAAHVLREIKDLFALAASGARFGCVYADPPWLYTNQATRVATSNHYKELARSVTAFQAMDWLVRPPGSAETDRVPVDCFNLFGAPFRRSSQWRLR
jgi:hypothetical protein